MVTTSDYLSRRDGETMGQVSIQSPISRFHAHHSSAPPPCPLPHAQVFRALGLSVGVVQAYQKEPQVTRALRLARSLTRPTRRPAPPSGAAPSISCLPHSPTPPAGLLPHPIRIPFMDPQRRAAYASDVTYVSNQVRRPVMCPSPPPPGPLPHSQSPT